MTSKEKQKIESEQLIDELSKMPAKVIATAYLHAINYTLYGEDVTEKWTTATQNASALEKAYKKGYYDALNGAENCRNCKKWDECPCGKEGHENGTSIGYSIGECKEYEPCEETREMLTADERALFLNKLGVQQQLQ